MNIDVTISIHALLAESDYSMGRNEKSFRGYFYPRSPCGERLRGWTLNINGPIFLSTLSLRRATPTQQRKTKTNEFLSTLSLRRATEFRELLHPSCTNFYPRSPCGERLSMGLDGRFKLYFYPRSPCGERLARVNSMLTLIQFLSTLSLRRATGQNLVNCIRGVISIHALLAESDRTQSASLSL